MLKKLLKLICNKIFFKKSMEYPWFEIVANSDILMQGDFILECPIIFPPSNYQELENSTIEISSQNSIIMSQSCDLENGKIKIVLVCPYVSLTKFLESHPESSAGTSKSIQKVKDNLVRGNYPAYHLLNKNELDERIDYFVVDFRNVFGVNIEFLKEHTKQIKSRMRLLPPYREHLSQSFARYFMRVGLPININY